MHTISFIKSNNDGDWEYQTGEYGGGEYNGDFESSPLPFHKDRSDVIEALKEPAAQSESSTSINFGKKVVIGDICLKSTQLDNNDVLAVCKEDCETSCTPVWTHAQAPVPK